VSNFPENVFETLFDSNLLNNIPALRPTTVFYRSLEGGRKRKLLGQCTYLLLTTSTRNCNNSRVFSGCPFKRMKNAIQTFYTSLPVRVNNTTSTVNTNLQINLHVCCIVKFKLEELMKKLKLGFYQIKSINKSMFT